MLRILLTILFAILAKFAIYMGIGFVLSKTMPSVPNKMCRFAFLFAVWVPSNFVINYVDVRLRGYHKMNWTAALIIAGILATWFTFWSPQPHGSNTA